MSQWCFKDWSLKDLHYNQKLLSQKVKRFRPSREYVTKEHNIIRERLKIIETELNKRKGNEKLD